MQAIPEISSVARSIKVRIVCSRGYHSVESNLRSGIINGGRSRDYGAVGNLMNENDANDPQL